MASLISEPSSSSQVDQRVVLDDASSSHSGVRSGSSRADVVVVAFETPDHLDRCLTSIAEAVAAGDQVGRIVVVDNSATDHCAEVVARHPTAELIRPPSNLGFARGVNLGLAATSGGADHVLVLNADTEVRPGAVGALVDHLVAHPIAAIAGPSLTTAGGQVVASCGSFPTPFRVLLAQTGLWKPVARVARRPDLCPLRNPMTSGPVPWVLGAALMLDRRAVEDVGGFDPGFHMYFEEVDLSRRLLAARRETHFVPGAAVHHVGGASSARAPSSMERVMYASLARHLRVHGRSPSLRRLRVAVGAIALANITRSAMTGRSPSPWRGILGDAVRGWPG